MSRGPTSAELDALTAWWKAQRHIGHAAKVLGRSRQRVASNLLVFRRLEGAADNVELALKYLDVIEQRWPDVLKRTSQLERFGEVVAAPWGVSERSDTNSVTSRNTKTRESRFIPLRLLAVPPSAISDRRSDVTAATELGQALAFGVRHDETAPAIALHRLRLSASQHRIRYEAVAREQRIVESLRHAAMVPA